MESLFVERLTGLGSTICYPDEQKGGNVRLREKALYRKVKATGTRPDKMDEEGIDASKRLLGRAEAEGEEKAFGQWNGG